MATSSWKVKATVSGMNGDLVELLDAAETDGVRGVEEILKDDEYVEANAEKRTKASWRNEQRTGGKYRNSEASAIARTVTKLDGVESHDYSGWSVSACMKDASQVRLAIMKWEET